MNILMYVDLLIIMVMSIQLYMIRYLYKLNYVNNKIEPITLIFKKEGTSRKSRTVQKPIVKSVQGKRK